ENEIIGRCGYARSITEKKTLVPGSGAGGAQHGGDFRLGAGSGLTGEKAWVMGVQQAYPLQYGWQAAGYGQYAESGCHVYRRIDGRHSGETHGWWPWSMRARY